MVHRAAPHAVAAVVVAHTVATTHVVGWRSLQIRLVALVVMHALARPSLWRRAMCGLIHAAVGRVRVGIRVHLMLERLEDRLDLLHVPLHVARVESDDTGKLWQEASIVAAAHDFGKVGDRLSRKRRGYLNVIARPLAGGRWRLLTLLHLYHHGSGAGRAQAGLLLLKRLIVEVPTPGQTAVRVASSSLSAHSLARARDRVLACFVGALACVSAPFFCSLQVFFAPKALRSSWVRGAPRLRRRYQAAHAAFQQ
mmetsp:Transcript_103957/g.299321  ORF Transcript_103957/g.299321 Transcript_103957/m.299321 type:complete len:253 (-) Transcript_103957:608-1366(-)